MATIRYIGPASPGYADPEDPDSWSDDLGVDVRHLLGRRMTVDEAADLDGWDVVEDDTDHRDAILLRGPAGQLALPRSLWNVDGAPRETVEQVLARVGDNPAAARDELARGESRKTLVPKLEAIAAGDDADTSAQGE